MLVDLVRLRLLDLRVDWEPLDVALSDDGGLVVLVLIEEYLIVQNDEILVPKKRLDFLITSAVVVSVTLDQLDVHEAC